MKEKKELDKSEEYVVY